jgi:hypothetical protein
MCKHFYQLSHLRMMIYTLLLLLLNIKCMASGSVNTDLIKINSKDGEINKYHTSDDLRSYYTNNPESWSDWYDKHCKRDGCRSYISPEYKEFFGNHNDYTDYFAHKITIYNFGLFASKTVEINLDEYCPSIINRYITLERSGFHNLLGYLVFRFYNRTVYIIRCHY